MLERGDVFYFEGVEKEPPIAVDEIVAMIPDRNGRFADPSKKQFFTDACAEVLELLDREAVAQGVEKYDRTKRIILVFELYRLFDRFFNAVRRNGENVWKDHLLDAVKILISKGGFLGLGKLLTMANHDTVEDSLDERRLDGENDRDYYARMSREREKILWGVVDSSDYGLLLEDFDPTVAQDIAKQVRTGVKGMTKLKRVTRGKDLTDKATFEAFVRALIDLPISGVFKPCDVLSNGKSYGVHERAKQIEKLAVAKRYLTVAERYGLLEISRAMVLQRIGYLNAGLQRDFEELRRVRLAQKLEPQREAILSKLIGPDGGFILPIEKVYFKERDIYDLTTRFRGKRDVKDVALDDLDLDPAEGLFEVVVLTRPSVARPTHEDRRMAISRAVAVVRAAFASGSLLTFDEEIPEEGSDGEYFGATIRIFDKNVGGELLLRVNDLHHESRAKRGLFAPYEDVPGLLDEVRQSMKLVLKPGFRERFLGVDSVFDAFERQMSPNTVGVYTPDRDYKKFPPSATVFDFAASVGQEVFLNMGGAGLKPVPKNAGKYYQISPVDHLRNGAMYYIVPAESSGDSYISPKAFPFCGSQAQGYLKKYYRSLDANSQAFIVQRYLQELSQTYFVDMDVIYEQIREMAGKSSENYLNEDIYRDILQGLCDPVLAVVRALEAEAREEGEEMNGNIWQFTIWIPDDVGSSAGFFAEFSKEADLNIYAYKTRRLKSGDVLLDCQFNLDQEGVTLRKLIYQILKLSYKYLIELSGSPIKRIQGKMGSEG